MSTPEIDALARRLDRLERANRRLRWTAFGGLLAAAIAFGVPGAARPRAVAAPPEGPRVTDPGDPLPLYDELHQTGRRAIDLVNLSLRVGAPVNNSPAVVAAWSLRILDAEIFRTSPKGGLRSGDPEVYLSTAKGPPDPPRVRAFQEHLNRMRAWEERFRPLASDRRLSALDFLELQARRIQAEGYLARELHKPRAE